MNDIKFFEIMAKLKSIQSDIIISMIAVLLSVQACQVEIESEQFEKIIKSCQK